MRVLNRVLHPVIPTQNVDQSRNPDSFFGIPPPTHTFNPESRPNLAFKARFPSFKQEKFRISKKLFGTLINESALLLYFNSYFAPSHKFRGKKKNKVSKAHRLAHRSLCEAQAVEMETYSKFKNNNKILFQN